MTYLEAIILGIVQGLGEFLPISSSAHLIIVPYLLGWQYHGLTFDVALHLGTLVALLAFFWRDFMGLIKGGLTEGTSTTNGRLFWMILAASIPAAVFGYVFSEQIDTLFRESLVLIALVLALMGVVLWYVDNTGTKKRDVQSLSWKDALLIGVAQALALFPGVSRSGATMSGGMLLGLTREAAARFSFLLSAPIVAAAAVFKLKDLTIGDVDGPFMVGVLTSAVVGYISIGFLLKFLQKGSLAVFALYRIVVAIIVLIAVLN